MAKLYITEYATAPIVRNGLMAGMGQEPGTANASSPITIAAGHAESTAFGTSTKFIRVHTDAICSIKIGPSAVAAATDGRMAASTTEYFGVRAGDVLSVITNT